MTTMIIRMSRMKSSTVMKIHCRNRRSNHHRSFPRRNAARAWINSPTSFAIIVGDQCLAERCCQVLFSSSWSTLGEIADCHSRSNRASSTNQTLLLRRSEQRNCLVSCLSRHGEELPSSADRSHQFHDTSLPHGKVQVLRSELCDLISSTWSTVFLGRGGSGRRRCPRFVCRERGIYG